MATKDINDAAKPIRDQWEQIKNEYFKCVPGKYLIITCVHRTPEEQFALYKEGRELDAKGVWVTKDKSKIVTKVDGYKVVGAHNYLPSRAIDVAVVDNQTGKTSWEAYHYWPLLAIAKDLGLVSGGSWTSIKDWPHIEVKDYKNYKGE